MEKALIQARIAYNMGEVPVGCIFVYRNQIIASGGNLVNQTKNATLHAEFVCIDQVLKYAKEHNLDYRNIFEEITVIVTVEPCIMCATALYNLKIKEVIYGCINDRFGGHTVLNIANISKHKIIIKGGVKSEEAMNLLKEFYKGENPLAPIPKKKNK